MNFFGQYFLHITIYIIVSSTAAPFLFGQTVPKIQTLVIDPGHGGHDDGCNYRQAHFEKDIVLGVALQLKKLLKQHIPQLGVQLTREEDIFVPLHQRADFANALPADLFISLHCNYIPGAAYIRGSETFVNGINDAQNATAKRENDAIYMENDMSEYSNLLSDEYHIFQALNQNAFLEESLQFANIVEAQFAAIPNYQSHGIKQARFVVLQRAEMPAVLIEIGFISNAKDRLFLLTQEGQNSIAQAIYKAISLYYQNN